MSNVTIEHDGRSATIDDEQEAWLLQEILDDLGESYEVRQ